MKASILIIVYFTLLTSCNSTPDKTNNLKTEHLIIQLTAQINDNKETQSSYKATGESKALIDSLYHIQISMERKLDSIYSETNLDYDQAEQNCLKEFGLDIKTMNAKQMNHLKLFYGYKLCTPMWISCGFVSDSTPELFNKRLSILNEAHSNYRLYIDSLLNKS